MDEIKVQETNVETESTQTTQEVLTQEQPTSEDKSKSKTEILREMSKEYGVNLFDAEGLAKFKEYQEAQKTEQEKLQEKLAQYKEEVNQTKQKVSQYEAQIAGLELGIPQDRLADALALAKTNMTEGQSIKESLEIIQNKYPESFKQVKKGGVQAQVALGTQMNNEDDSTLNIDIDPAVARYEARKSNKKY